jgi:putative membrane protein
MTTRLYIIIALLLVVVIFTLQNTEMVSISFLFWKFGMPRALLIFSVFVIGVLVGWFVNGMTRHKIQKQKLPSKGASE